MPSPSGASAARLHFDPVAHRSGVAHRLLEEIVARTEAVEDHAAVWQEVFAPLLRYADRIRKHLQRIGFGEIGDAVELALRQQSIDQGFGLADQRLAQHVDGGRRQDAGQHRAGTRMQRRVGFENDARRPPWRLLPEIAETHARAGTIALPVRQGIAHLLVPRHPPDTIPLQPHHRPRLAHCFVVGIGILQEGMRERINAGNGALDLRIHDRVLPFVRAARFGAGI